MRKIYKYPLYIRQKQTLSLPKGYQIISVGVQHSQLQLWVMVDINEIINEDVNFEIYVTGHWIETEPHWLNHIGTVQEMDGSLVWHIFQNIKP